jgi:hypothetical protein
VFFSKTKAAKSRQSPFLFALGSPARQRGC